MPDASPLPYLPAARKALETAQTVEQLMAALNELEKFRGVWEFVADRLREAIPDDAPGSPGQVSPPHAMAALKDIEALVRTIDQDVQSCRSRALVVAAPTAVVPSTPAAPVEAAAPIEKVEAPAPAPDTGQEPTSPPATPS